MIRRQFLALFGAGATLGYGQPKAESESEISVVRFDRLGHSEGLAKVEKVVLSEAEWKKRLSPAQFSIARQADTEVPFTGKNWNNHQQGLYRCVCCSNALFSSEAKFESGTGWPSFWKPVAKENIKTVLDLSFGVRNEVRCRRCEAHLGHVFPDGPQPTGLRYCMNGNVMAFEKFADQPIEKT